jgi:hypothetical protein
VTPKLWRVSGSFMKKLTAERRLLLCYSHGSLVLPCSRKRERRNRCMISSSMRSKSGIRVVYPSMILCKYSWTQETSCQQLWGYGWRLLSLLVVHTDVHCSVHDGSRNGWFAVHWYYRHVMVSRYREKPLTLSQLPGCYYFLVVIRSGVTKHAQKSRT